MPLTASLRAGERLTLRATAATPRHIGFERGDEELGGLTFAAIGRSCRATVGDRAYAVHRDDRLELESAAGERAWHAKGRLWRADRVVTGRDATYVLHTDRTETGATARLAGPDTDLAFELRVTTGLRIVLADLTALPPADAELVVLTAALAVFLTETKHAGGLIPGENAHKAPMTAAASAGH